MSTFDTSFDPDAPTDIALDAMREETEPYLTDDEHGSIGFADGYFGRANDPVGSCPVQRDLYAAGYARGGRQRLAELTTAPGR